MPRQLFCVLLPPAQNVSITNMVDLLALDGRFTTLLTALEVAGLKSARQIVQLRDTPRETDHAVSLLRRVDGATHHLSGLLPFITRFGGKNGL